MADFDLAIIGGGINGAGIARDAAGRGLKVVLVEQNDLASGTSSASSKLIHGGLRYLEHGAFRLVRAALSRARSAAAHGAAPDPAAALRAAARRGRPLAAAAPARPVRLRPGRPARDPARHARRSISSPTPPGMPLERRFITRYEYSDCFADDARLVVLNARRCGRARRRRSARARAAFAPSAATGGGWFSMRAASATVVTARVLVNAAGAWVETRRRDGDAADAAAPAASRQRQPHRGARLYDHDRAYILQAPDGRVVFAIPFAARLHPDRHDRPRLRRRSRRGRADGGGDRLSLRRRSTIISAPRSRAADVVWAFAGVRALYDDGARKPQDIGRDYALVLDRASGEAPLLTVYGGKLTTYRRLAEDALARLSHFFPALRGRGPRQARCRAATSSMTASRRWSRARGGNGRF